MNPSEANDPVDALLREQNIYLEDSGFTARVVKSLPRRRRAWLRPAILLGAIGIGAMLAIRWLPWGDLPPLDFSAFVSSNSPMLPPWILVVSVVGALAWSIVTAIPKED